MNSKLFLCEIFSEIYYFYRQKNENIIKERLCISIKKYANFKVSIKQSKLIVLL